MLVVVPIFPFPVPDFSNIPGRPSLMYTMTGLFKVVVTFEATILQNGRVLIKMEVHLYLNLILP